MEPRPYTRAAAYCYRPSSVVCLSVNLCVKVLSPANTAEPIEMPFGLRIQVELGLGWAQGNMYYVGCTLASPVEYHCAIHVRRRCGLLSLRPPPHKIKQHRVRP